MGSRSTKKHIRKIYYHYTRNPTDNLDIRRIPFRIIQRDLNNSVLTGNYDIIIYSWSPRLVK